MHESQKSQPLELRFCACLADEIEMELMLV